MPIQLRTWEHILVGIASTPYNRRPHGTCDAGKREATAATTFIQPILAISLSLFSNLVQTSGEADLSADMIWSFFGIGQSASRCSWISTPHLPREFFVRIQKGRPSRFLHQMKRAKIKYPSALGGSRRETFPFPFSWDGNEKLFSKN